MENQQEQMALPIYTPTDPISRAKHFWSQWLITLRRRNETAQFNTALRSEGFAFAAVGAVFVNVTIFGFSAAYFGALPPQVRFFYDAAADQGILADKSLAIIAPILLLVLESIVLRLNWEVYRFDERLANVISWIITAVNVITALAAVQLFSIALGI